MLCRIIKYFFPLFPAEWENYRRSEIKTVNYSPADSLRPGISIYLTFLLVLFCTQVSYDQSKIFWAGNNHNCSENSDGTGITDFRPGFPFITKAIAVFRNTTAMGTETDIKLSSSYSISQNYSLQIININSLRAEYPSAGFMQETYRYQKLILL